MTGSERPEQDDVGLRTALLHVLADKLPAMLAYWDANLRCRFANRAYEKWFGVDPETMIGRDMKEFLGPLFPLNQPYVEGALRGEEQEFEREIPDPAGGPPRHSQAHYIPDIVEGTVRGFCVLVADITRHKRAEEALREMERQLHATERLAAMSTLAAGIAHEINNPLAATLANVELALERLDSGPPNPPQLHALLVEAREGAKRARDIVRSMKLLARGDTTRRELVDVNAVLEQSIGFAANEFRYRARLVRELGRVGHIEGNASQLAQVFVNLLVNAGQALPEETAGRNEVRVSTRREGDDVVIEVADNGRGIPDELQSRIFEPFFTTKDVGVGTGLGLPISSGIVDAFGGSLTVRSKVGEGSVFRVVLPSALEAAAPPAATPPVPEVPPTGASTTNSAARPRVLVIDDDVAVASTLELVLADDCDVVVVNHGRDALAILACDPAPRFDVIFCDLMMPELSGEDVYSEAIRTHPELAPSFVFMTGGAFTPRGRQFLDSVAAPVLEKPFDLARVRALVRAGHGRGSA